MKHASSRATATLTTLGGFLCAQAAVDAVQAVLGAPGDLHDVVRQPFVAAGERGTDAGLAEIVPGGFDEDPPGVAGAGLGDRPVGVCLAGLLAGGHESEPGAQLDGAGEASEVADLEHDHQRRERVDPAERSQPADDPPELVIARDMGESLVKRLAAYGETLAGGDRVNSKPARC